MSTPLEKAAALGPSIRAACVNVEHDCRVPAPVISELQAAGLTAMTAAQRYGGGELDAIDSLQVLEELSWSDSAVGWCAMIYATTGMLGSFLPESWARQVYGGTASGSGGSVSISAGAAAPAGRGVVVDGGVRVSGRWPWGSGTHHCDWICGGTLVEENGELRRHPNGEPIVHVMFFERNTVQLHDNWNPSGLRGTGSVDFEVQDVLVPEGRWTQLGVSRRQIDSPLFRFPFFGYFATAVACVPLGIARRALDDFEDLARSKRQNGGASIGAGSIVQLEFGRAEGLIAGARHHLFGSVAAVWDKVARGTRLAVEDRRALRLAASQATASCATAVDLLYNAAGGSALQGDCPLQRHFRDIHAATQHRMVSAEILRMAAAVRLNDQPPGQL